MSGPAVHRDDPEILDIIQRFGKLYTGLVYDILDELGMPHQCLASDIRPMRPDMRLAGPAFTFQGISDAVGDPNLRERRIKMFGEMRHPWIDVRDCGFDTRVAHYGEMNATLSRAKGITGALIDGGVRDSGHIMRMNFPVFHRYYCPVEAKGRWGYYKWQLPIQLRGQLSATVTVRPGDFVFGDIDGVLIIPKERLVEVLRKSEEMEETENRARAEFADPKADAEEVYKRYGKL